MVSSKIAVTHASGLLAEALLVRMSESGIKSDNVILLDRELQAGNRLSYGDTYLTVEDQYEYDYEDLAAVLLLEPDAELESLLQHADCFVISHHVDKVNNSVFTPEITAESNLPEQPCALKLASAELSTLLLVSKVIHNNFGVKSLNVVNVFSSSFYGKTGVEELASQTISLLNSQDVKSTVFPLQLAFNMIPDGDESIVEEQLVRALQADDLKCSVQNILVPAFHGLSISVSLEMSSEVDIEKISSLLNEQQGIRLVEQTISPLTDCKTGADVLISGLYQPQNDFNRLQFWIVADSVRNGLIQNYLNMLEILLKSYL
jgi:aspartate-semialdehyde dehydrogenase